MGEDRSDGTLLCGRYRLEDHLASGGMGEVWRATDVALDRPVAVKLLHDHLGGDPDLVARFRREARAAARLDHPGIVAVYDTCTDGGRQAIVLQLVDGPTLRTYLDRTGRLTPDQTVTLGVAVAEALGVAHDAGIVHRDIKPANILLGPERAMVTDFGVAKALDDTDHTATGALLGSVRYLSPEQVRGEPPDGRSDLFSLGVVLHECLSGSVPWDASTPAATALARLEGAAPSLGPDVPPALADVVARCLAVDPAQRYPSARAAAAALRGSLGPTAPTTVAGDATVVSVDPTVMAPTDVVDARHDGWDTGHDEGNDGWDGDDDWDDEPEAWTGLGRRGCAGPVALAGLLLAAVIVIVALIAGIDPQGWLGGG